MPLTLWRHAWLRLWNLGRPPIFCWDCGLLYPRPHRRTADDDRCQHPLH